MKMDRVFVALDETDWQRFERLIFILRDMGSGAKIGMEAFYAHGVKAVELAAHHGLPVFLDLKLHDIPNTVEKAVLNLIKLPITMLNVHASGGPEMLKAAQAARQKSGRKDVLLIAVTQLTSTTESLMQNQLLLRGTMEEVVRAYAQMTMAAGLDGVVCSPWEAADLKLLVGEDCLCVTPGIRPTGAPANDQKRTATPQEALAFGADYLVIGRPITAAADPARALETLFKD